MLSLLDIKPEAELVYDTNRWKLLQRKRRKAKLVLEILSSIGIEGYIYGSVARGDVHEGSDIDVVILETPLPHSLVEDTLSREFGDPIYREVIQATPQSTPKYYIHLNSETTVSIPIGRLKEREEEFYKFGGRISLKGILNGERVPGVNKDLRLIMPTEKGHLEYPVIGYEEAVARVLNVGKGVVEERVRVLTKRRTVGTTGLYLSYRLVPRETFEEAVLKLKKVKKGFRNRLAGELLI
ncbi:MAG TPA: DNA polymerase subunit beta [Candidatus Korarchaeota archaeon]|nr:DNA polymerase subunit beta [Candidatus Korarchaeota archaeon]